MQAGVRVCRPGRWWWGCGGAESVQRACVMVYVAVVRVAGAVWWYVRGKERGVVQYATLRAGVRVEVMSPAAVCGVRCAAGGVCAAVAGRQAV